MRRTFPSLLCFPLASYCHERHLPKPLPQPASACVTPPITGAGTLLPMGSGTLTVYCYYLLHVLAGATAPPTSCSLPHRDRHNLKPLQLLAPVLLGRGERSTSVRWTVGSCFAGSYVISRAHSTLSLVLRPQYYTHPLKESYYRRHRFSRGVAVTGLRPGSGDRRCDLAASTGRVRHKVDTWRIARAPRMSAWAG